MTNFEKWKSELTEDEIAGMVNDAMTSCFRCSGYPVSNCDETGNCFEDFMKWANEESVEETK